MKTIIPLLFLTVTLINGCEEHDVIKGVTGITYTHPKIISTEYKITLDSVSDSRCPREARCFWAGNARVSFTFYERSHKTPFKLNTCNCANMKSDTLLGNYRITLRKLTPENSLSDPPKLVDYEADVEITTEGR